MARPWRLEGAVEQRIEADPQVVYERVVDVTAVDERSLECRSCEWLPGAPPGTVGARFRGRNRAGLARWSRVCEVIAAEPGSHFAFRTIPERFDPSRADSTTWSYTIRRDGSGSHVTHAYRIEKLPLAPFRLLYGLVMPHHRDMRPHMAHTLERLQARLQ